MQNFWWNRKFYHGKEEPDSFRLHRLEEAQTMATAAVEALAKAQTALEQLLSAHDGLLSEHTTLLSDLTDIAGSLQEGIDGLVTECNALSSDLLVLENNDSALSARLDGIEEACADTAAEQATKIDTLAQTTAEQLAALEAETEKISALDAELTKQKMVLDEQYRYKVGALALEGETVDLTMRGAIPCSIAYVRDSAGVEETYLLTSSQDTRVTLLPGKGAVYGRMESLDVEYGDLSKLELRGMTCLEKLRLRNMTLGSLALRLSSVPHLYEVKAENVTGTIDLTKQTKIQVLTLINCPYVKLPERLEDLSFIHLDGERANDEAFLDKLLPMRSEDYKGYIFLSGATPPDWLAERYWEVIG